MGANEPIPRIEILESPRFPELPVGVDYALRTFPPCGCSLTDGIAARTDAMHDDGNPAGTHTLETKSRLLQRNVTP